MICVVSVMLPIGSRSCYELHDLPVQHCSSSTCFRGWIYTTHDADHAQGIKTAEIGSTVLIVLSVYAECSDWASKSIHDSFCSLRGCIPTSMEEGGRQDGRRSLEAEESVTVHRPNAPVPQKRHSITVCNSPPSFRATASQLVNTAWLRRNSRHQDGPNVAYADTLGHGGFTAAISQYLSPQLVGPSPHVSDHEKDMQRCRPEMTANTPDYITDVSAAAAQQQCLLSRRYAASTWPAGYSLPCEGLLKV